MQEHVGLSAVNDVFLLEQAIFRVIDAEFSSTFGHAEIKDALQNVWG